ncbi:MULTISPECIES: hypothetical protein [Nitrospirillum]|uniref:Integrase-like protein n=1 Tax=Nitrospirillum amazonense TaxID=28077 RepID=A0A560F1R6_9PROT|nr:hypothetical protein [Nitrospirillum amazonense]MEC4594739.1 hypothetical protein [Nitrospirillum amazonense]TWB15573.1 hypothetical protein FBZ88_12926 [Nitrospirillum amazonense]
MATIIPRENREGQVIGYQAKVRRVGHKPVSKTFEKKKDAERWASRSRRATATPDNLRVVWL